jgi:redox-sensitive bicupin YhaK (pirin superfamily)
VSGPVTEQDEEPIACTSDAPARSVEVTAPKESQVGSLTVHRVLPRRGRRTVGSWCFADVMAPVADGSAGGIGPHPHIGLQTVTWLLDGELLHLDSLGSEQPIRAGQLNLMTAGRGVAHAEESRGHGRLHGIQLWIAQPESTRHGDAAFEHHADLPVVDLHDGQATVVVGTIGDVASPARRDTEHVGAELRLQGTVEVPLAADFEHALLPVIGDVVVDGTPVAPAHLAHLGAGRSSVTVGADEPAVALLLGGEPFPDELVMWWNYVGRTRDEIAAAHAAWTARDGRFGTVRSSLAEIDVPPPPWAPGR